MYEGLCGEGVWSSPPCVDTVPDIHGSWCGVLCEKSRPRVPCHKHPAVRQVERDADSALLTTGAVYIDQYCNPLSDISFRDIQAQIHSIVELVCKTLRGVNSRHPSLTFRAGVELLEKGWAAGALG